jgi:hypothetical protein
MPRPRDLIFMFREVIGCAVNRGHATVTDNDALKAEERYSQYVLDSLVHESGMTIEQVESLLFGFVGEPAVLGRETLLTILCKAGVKQDECEAVTKVLVDIGFLGLEVSPEHFEYSYDENRRGLLYAKAAKYSASSVSASRFKVNRPFHRSLEIVAN